MSGKKITTRMCSKCKKVFPVGQGHDARTCGKDRKLSPLDKTKSTTTPAHVSKIKTGAEKGGGCGSGEEERKQKKLPPQKDEEKNFFVVKKVPLELFKGSIDIADSGEVRISYDKNLPRTQPLPLEWRKEYNCISDASKTVWFNDEGKVHNPSNKPAVIWASGLQEWRVGGKLHREDGPAAKWASGSEEWRRNGVLHREDGPAKTDRKGNKEWRLEGKLHRLDGPALELADGHREWWVNGELHRTDGPAVEYANGHKEWWVNGKQHRLDGPAVEYADGDKEWWVNDKRHRIDGPAVEKANGCVQWWVNGWYLSLYADHPDVPEIMGEYFYLLCVNSDSNIKDKALANPNCPPAYKVAGQILQK